MTDLKSILAQLTPLSEETAVWWQSHLEITYYLTDIFPPIDLVSSVRAILFKDENVMVIQSKDKSYQIVPGGRCEPNEKVEETLRTRGVRGNRVDNEII